MAKVKSQQAEHSERMVLAIPPSAPGCSLIAPEAHYIVIENPSAHGGAHKLFSRHIRRHNYLLFRFKWFFSSNQMRTLKRRTLYRYYRCSSVGETQVGKKKRLRFLNPRRSHWRLWISILQAWVIFLHVIQMKLYQVTVWHPKFDWEKLNKFFTATINRDRPKVLSGF